jgi:hypothetical protein
MVTYKEKYNAKYKFPKGTGHSKADISKKTVIPVRILDTIYDRGVGARKSNPESVRSASTGKKIGGKSLKGKMSAEQWGQARVYSFIMKGKTYKTADKDLADELKKLKIKGYIR